jgi:quinol monooxygenase YgiN
MRDASGMSWCRASQPRLLTFLEEWEDQEALDKHMAAPHFTDIVPRLADCLEEPGEVTLYRELL